MENGEWRMENGRTEEKGEGWIEKLKLTRESLLSL